MHLAAASYVNRNYHGSLNAIDSLFKFAEDSSMKIKPQEFSEVILLAIRNHECLGQYEEALKLLNQRKDKIVDMVAKYDYEGRIHLKLGDTKKATEAYEELLQLNSANL